ncbi:unnamed protein product (macronuclear) [Paramecium tetraurelia]|uniref:Uncharacterized protein n=1 Tax=Paramecium tetraurelia TaxID=5888 RepID=A0D8J9_PARTE|nr:uncharacterized protein GSPATT00014312001 [Paramecium tetraurelia]CAK79366.1 unnamed protein product [Paramecium tetraurelia]|eukprot:XP_001446763.1 hypothetical protein (macronuclear) [Paramecium tetraurelia strain d4-2]
MKSDKEILNILRRYKEAKVELKKYLSWIEQIKLEMVLSAQSERQSNYYRMQIQGIDNKLKHGNYPTSESLTDEVQTKCNQMTFQSQQQELNQDNVREFINKYEKMLVQKEQQQHINQNSGQTLLINRDSKQHFGTSTIEDMFKLSQSQQESQQINQFSYDTSNFGNDHIGGRRQGENYFNNLQNYSKDYEQEQSLQSSKCFKDYMITQEKVDVSHNQNKQEQKKSFEQFYQEHVEEEINNIQMEIEEMQRFLQRVQTAKDKLTNSFQDLQQIPVINRESSEKSIQKVTEDLKLIDIIKQNMIKQMENNIDSDKLKKLRNMKHQIQLYFNNVEDELLKINEEASVGQ